MSFAYPGLVDAEASLAVIYGEFSGNPVPTADLVKAIYTAVGYGLSVALPAQGLAAAQPEFADVPALKKQVVDLLAPHMADGTMKAAAIPWAALVALLLKLLPWLVPVVP